MPDDFRDDEGQEFPGKIGIKISLFRKPFQTFDLLRLAGRVGRRQIVFGLEPTHRLRLLEAFGKGLDQDRVQPVDAGAMVPKQGLGDCTGVAHAGIPAPE
jgi:hypothetical protein